MLHKCCAWTVTVIACVRSRKAIDGGMKATEHQAIIQIDLAAIVVSTNASYFD